MRTYKIYTAGKMAGLEEQEQMAWRYEIQREINDVLEYGGMDKASVQFVHPPQFYQYGEGHHQSEREVKNWELNQVRKSDIVIVNLEGVESSIGTHYELATADAINSFGNKHIFVIGIGSSTSTLHPWIEETLHRREVSLKSAARYIVDYLLI